MHIPVRVPKRKNRVSPCSGGKDLITFHCRILTVHVIKQVGMDERMIKCGIENHFLVGGTSFNPYTGKLFLPAFAGSSPDLIKLKAVLLGLQVFAGIGSAYEGNPDLYFDGFTRFNIVRKVGSDIVSGNIPPITGVNFPCACRTVPGSLCCHFALFLPISGSQRWFADTHHKINGKNRLRVVTKSPQHFHPLNFGITDATHPGTTFVGKPFPQVQQYICVPFRKGKTGDTRACSGRNFG
ncbi:hypothetical protein SDC9_114005 [bioreactor metagenome]|uniref:Uncharacterized protein n=1 Tax=bioreactor metagenome TaxID=1076179 RepID=A0A645BPN6_9ZZZZ